MQKVIRSEFPDHTIIAIAHRLDTILDFDQIIIMDKGVVAEVGNPRQLLDQASPSKFKALYMDSSLSTGLDNTGTSTLGIPKKIIKRPSAVFTIGGEDDDDSDEDDDHVDIEKPRIPELDRYGQQSKGENVQEQPEEDFSPLNTRPSLLDLFSTQLAALDSMRSSPALSELANGNRGENQQVDEPLENGSIKRTSEIVSSPSLLALFSALGDLPNISSFEEGSVDLHSRSQSQTQTNSKETRDLEEENSPRPSSLQKRPSLLDLFSYSLDNLGASPEGSVAGSSKGKDVEKEVTVSKAVVVEADSPRPSNLVKRPSLMDLFSSGLDKLGNLPSEGSASGSGSGSGYRRSR
jgi:ABC-type multidrug transport system ATPase subunit